MRHFERIKSGPLTVTTTQERVPLVNILTFAARPNPKRGFYFVSKVLGRHLPVAPSVFGEYAGKLADMVERDSGPYLVVGLGEAAISLGGAVAKQLAERDGELMIYTFTTRQNLGYEAMFSFEEAHSHAPGHLLYTPLDHLRDEYEAAEHLILVDDEMTTGRTVTELAKQLCKWLPKLRKVTVVSLVSWVSSEQYALLAHELGDISSTFDTLVNGRYNFEFNREFEPVLPPRTDKDIGRFYPCEQTGRRGIVLEDMDTSNWKVPTLDINQPVLVLGTVEFSLQPYLLAHKLEDRGHTVKMLCTTRTPIVVGDAIKARFAFDSIYGDPESPVHYLYNVPSDHQVVACFENQQQAETYGLRDEVDFTPWVMDEDARAPQSAEGANGEIKCCA